MEMNPKKGVGGGGGGGGLYTCSDVTFNRYTAIVLQLLPKRHNLTFNTYLDWIKIDIFAQVD